ncbi:HlyC/CorC family transporter [Candidatus Micrarchaeota archaeon]|nr:HlyC/CorC family transporter [Candidatus Micrarchaeota archaeon]
MGVEFSVLALVALIAANAFFSALEVAFLSVSRIRLHRMLDRKASGSQSLARLKAHPERTIIAVLIGSNVAGVAASVLAADIAVQLFGDLGLGIATGVMTLVLLTLGEVTPKTLASAHAEPIALLSAPFLEVLQTLLSPLIWLFDGFNRAVAGPHAKSVAKVTEDEVRAAIRLGHQDSAITALERHYIENVLHFNDQTVAQCMTPKSRVVSFDAGMAASDALKKALSAPYSRFPVLLHGSAVGIVTVKRLAAAVQSDPRTPVADCMRTPALLLPSSTLATEAFARMQADGVNLAVVVDSGRRYVGIIALEDLLEELVGEIA